jgi:hypothetical protein
MEIPGGEAVCRKPGKVTVHPRLREAWQKAKSYCNCMTQLLAVDLRAQNMKVAASTLNLILSENF